MCAIRYKRAINPAAFLAVFVLFTNPCIQSNVFIKYRRKTVQLHHQFIEVAKKYGDKLAIRDLTTNKEIPYARALIATLLLSRVFRKLDKGFIGVMIPTSAGCILTNIGILMSGRTGYDQLLHRS